MPEFAEGIVEITGPFDTPEEADDWRFAEENYSPALRVVKDFDETGYYVVDVSEDGRYEFYHELAQ